MEKTLLNVIKKHETICWYPSAGFDFRSILYLSDEYNKRENVKLEGKVPSLFILSDYSAFSTIIRKISLEEEKNLFEDDRTKITVTESEEIAPLDTKIETHLAELDWIDQEFFNSVYRFKVKVSSLMKKGEPRKEWQTELVYVSAENTAFLRDFLLENKAKVDYIIRVRYGTGFGGAKGVQGDYLTLYLKELGTKYFVANEVRDAVYDYNYVNRYGIVLPRRGELPKLEPVHTIDGTAWSDCGRVSWYAVK